MKGNREISNTANVIDSRDVIARIEYLDTQVQAGKLDDWKHVLVARQALAQAEGK